MLSDALSPATRGDLVGYARDEGAGLAGKDQAAAAAAF